MPLFKQKVKTNEEERPLTAAELRARSDAFDASNYQRELDAFREFIQTLGSMSHIANGHAAFEPRSLRNPMWSLREVDAERMVQTLRQEGVLEGFNVQISAYSICVSW